MNKVKFYSADRPINLDNKNLVIKIVDHVFSSENKKLKKIAFIFCSDMYLLDINQKHLKHNYYTDVISFLTSLPNEPIESEVYISVERVKENAKLFKASYETEVLRVIIHGALHLCGYADKSKKEKNIMRKKEGFYIQLYSHST